VWHWAWTEHWPKGLLQIRAWVSFDVHLCLCKHLCSNTASVSHIAI
jgi:hypothetical protein